MSNTQENLRSPARRATRSSVACAACRYKHFRCDGKQPVCSRCLAEGKECIYYPSRRRKDPKTRPYQLPTAGSTGESVSETTTRLDSYTSTTSSDPTPSITYGHSHSENDHSHSHFLELYYEFFHTAHPCVLPLQFLRPRLMDKALGLLVQVMHYIGSIFNQSVPSEELNGRVRKLLVEMRSKSRPITGFDVQAVLLYSIAVYWCNESEQGVALLHEAVQMAVDLGMYRKEFASQHGQNDLVLQESWRRTWWLIFITDAHIAGSTHVFPFRTSHIDVTVDLPCEEQDYESGNIPFPRSLQEYDMREFFPDEDMVFSSYAELIGVTRGLDAALSQGSTSDVELYKSTCANADTSVLAWYTLLPPSKKRLIRADGSVDEIMFKAQFILHTYTIEMHRPLSSLVYSPIESVSRCAPLAPSDQLRSHDPAERHIHTTKCLWAIEKLNQLLTLPANMHSHSPFIICMIANVTIAHLSACRFVVNEKERPKCREKIRLTLGTLKTLSEYWLLGKRTYREIGIIARELLCLSEETGTSASGSTTTLSEVQQLQPPGEIPSWDWLPDEEMDFYPFPTDYISSNMLGDISEPLSSLLAT